MILVTYHYPLLYIVHTVSVVFELAETR